jgi:hypothetical protein
MADFVITKVRFNPAGTHITEVLVHDEGKPAATRVEQRSKVVENIKAKKTYRTQPPGGGAGANVAIVDVNGTPYLRTDANKTPKDNLDNLPTF